MKTEIVDIKEAIFEMIKTKFAGLYFWKTIEAQVAIYCSDLIDPLTPDKTKQLIKQLQQIKDFFLGHDVSLNELDFLKDEIERYEQTKTISLYEEEDDEVSEEDIEYYARHGGSTEGVVGIHLPFNYTQLEKLTNGVFKKTGLIKFYISREKIISGKIIAEVWEDSKKIPIATLVESRKTNEDGCPVHRDVSLFGKNINGKVYIKVKEINLPFYFYRFLTEENQEIVLLSHEKCDIGDCIVTGVMTQYDDYKNLTDTTKILTKLPFFFAQKVMNRIIKFKSHEELRNRLRDLKINRENFAEYPFTIEKNNISYELLQPEWYKLLIWSWLTHQPKGILNNYPMHLCIMGIKGSGKSSLLNGLHQKSRENRDVFSGSSSTLKDLVPSFKYNPAKLGYLAESNRFSFCDEFFRCLFNTRTTKEGSQREESVAMMNDLLEHQKRRAGSGVSSVNLNMTSRVIATTNPIRGMENISDLVNSFDESFLSRWMFYNQTEDHVNMTYNSNDSDLKKYNFKISTNDWVSILDYLHSFSAEYNMDKIKEIYEAIRAELNETLSNHYVARHKHHIECLIDGIVKSRCILDGDMSFNANEEDYKSLKIVWFKLISSWIDFEKIKYMNINDRIFYMPEKCQYIYWEIVKLKKPISRSQAKEMVLKTMKKSEFYEAWSSLIDNELIKESNGIARPHFMEEFTDDNKKKKYKKTLF